MLIFEILLYVGTAISGWWAGCYLRIMPTPLMRTWFTLIFATTLIGLYLTTFFIDLLRFVGFKRSLTGRMCSIVTTAWFKWCSFMNPHIRLIPIHGARTDATFAEASKYKRHLVGFNHTSFYDGFAGLSIAPLRLTWDVRTIYKSTLANIPLWGPTYARRNDFAVFFTSNEKFTTDREKQDKETARMKSWVNDDDGTIALFPEGQLNKDPLKIQPIRHGMLKFAIEQDMPVWLCVQMGSYESWPLKAVGVGGHPADIYYDVKQFYFKEGETVEEASIRMQNVMQGMVDEVVAVKNKALKKKE